MAVISINYKEAGKQKNLGYKSVCLSYKEGKKIFNSGDFVKDWFDCKGFAVNEGIINKEPIMHSSSVDHFLMDGAKFESAYLHLENDEPVLKYIDRSDPNWYITQRHIDEDGWEFFVDEGTKPTWNELRVRCGMEQKQKNERKRFA